MFCVFRGGDSRAGRVTAIIYSIVVTCQGYGADPLAYMRDVLSRLPTMNNQEDLTLLLPHHCQPRKPVTRVLGAQAEAQ